MVQSLPPMARGIEVKFDQTGVRLAMAVNREELLAGLKATAEPPATVAAAAPAAKHETPVKPAGPQVIRILGLDGGPREIVLH
jgi:hypothetical protein